MATALAILVLFSGCAPFEAKKTGLREKELASTSREAVKKSARKKALEKARARAKLRAKLKAEALGGKFPAAKTAITPSKTTITPGRPPVEMSEAKIRVAEKPRLTELNFNEFPGGLRISVGSTSIIQYTAYMVKDPAKLNITIFGTEVGSFSGSREVNKEPVKTVRGTYLEDQDISRLEIELTGEVPYSIERLENRIVVNLFSKPEAQVEVIEKRPNITISSVDYRELEDQVEVDAVFEGRNPQFKVVRLKEPLRLVLEILDATVEEEKKLIPELPLGAIESISISRSERAGHPSVKIVVLLTDAAPYIVYQEGNSIKLDIDNPVPPPVAPSMVQMKPEPPQQAPTTPPPIVEKVPEGEAGAILATPKKTPLITEKVPESSMSATASPGGPSAQAVVPKAVTSSAETQIPIAAEEAGPQGTSQRIGTKYTGTKISLDFQDAELTDILRLIAEVSGYNIITGPGVSGQINMKMEGVPWDQALDLILKTRDFDYIREGNVLWVDEEDIIERELLERKEREEEAQAVLIAEQAKKEEVAAPAAPAELLDTEEGQYITRIFSVNYVATNRTGTGGLSTGGGGGGDDDDAGGGGTTVAIMTEDTPDIWGTLTEGLNTILFGESSAETSRADGLKKLIVNKFAGIVQITATPEEMTMAAEFLQTMEESILRQVMIEVNLVEVLLSDDFQMGVDWSLVAEIANDLSGGLSGGGLAVQKLASNTSTFQFAVTDNDNIRVFIDALSVQGQINTLSNPKIVTLNNQKAIIKVGNEEVFFDLVTTLTQAGSVTTATPRTITVGVVMDVTPHISADNIITMAVHPSVTALVGTAVEPVTGARAPLINTREANTVVTLKDGQTLVLAGLIQDRTDITRTSVPFLGKLPLLGVLFRKSVEVKRKSELVIFITPTIMNGKKITDITHKHLDKLKSSPERFSN